MDDSIRAWLNYIEQAIMEINSFITSIQTFSDFKGFKNQACCGTQC